MEFKENRPHKRSRALRKLILRLGLLASERLGTNRDDTVRFTSATEEDEMNDDNYEVTFSRNVSWCFFISYKFANDCCLACWRYYVYRVGQKEVCLFHVILHSNKRYPNQMWLNYILIYYNKTFGYMHRIYRGYYTAVRRYEFYLRVVKTIFYERAQRVSKILFSPRDDKIHIFKPPCNVLLII